MWDENSTFLISPVTGASGELWFLIITKTSLYDIDLLKALFL